MQATSIGDALFTKTQQRVLGLLYGTPDKSFYTNEIMRWADMGRGTIRRELDRLVSAGILSVTPEGNQNHYQAKQDNPVYTELLGIVRKTFGVADVIRQAMKPLSGQIKLAFIYGSIAKVSFSASFKRSVAALTNPSISRLSGGSLLSCLIRTRFSKVINHTFYYYLRLLHHTYQETTVLIKSGCKFR